MDRRILYISFDGVLQPLFYSQVVRVLRGASRRGLRYRLVSLERTRDLSRADHVAKVSRVLKDADIEWLPVPTDMSDRSARRSGLAMARVVQYACKLAWRNQVTLTHARSYQGAAVARLLQSTFGVPYLFDLRGCWIDERSGLGDWFSRPVPYAAGKLGERIMLEHADAVVSLTELQAADVRDGPLAGRRGTLVVVIPTCTDYEVFALRDSRPQKPIASVHVPTRVQERLRGKLVLVLVGALQRYLTQQALDLARRVGNVRPDVHLLILSKQEDEYASLVRSSGFPEERVTIAGPEHEQMADWLQWVDWGLLLSPQTAAQRGTMPTKLAEFLATGVRPVAYGCNSEVTGWVRRAGSGLVLEDLTEASLEHAAGAIARSDAPIGVLRAARDATEPHFGLRGGVDRYVQLTEQLLSRRRGHARAAAQEPRR